MLLHPRAGLCMSCLILLSPLAMAGNGSLPGAGTSEDPFLVSDYADLKVVGDTVKGYGLDKVYRLVADIDASASASEDGGMGFRPIGGKGMPFRGGFHGAGHAIRKLWQVRLDSNGVGLFGQLKGARIDSLELLDGWHVGDQDVGTLAGSIDSASVIRASLANGNVQGRYYVGGLVGYNGGTIQGCLAAGRANARPTAYGFDGDMIGGLVGTNNGTIRQSYALGRVVAHAYAGGLVGENWVSGRIVGSHASGAVSASNAAWSGGLVGEIRGAIDSSLWDRDGAGRDTVGRVLSTPVDAMGLRWSALRQAAATARLGDFGPTGAWFLREDSTLPSLRGVDNPPAARFRIVDMARPLAGLLDGAYDVETGAFRLVVRIDSLDGGTTDSLTRVDFPADSSAASGLYRLGEVRPGRNDTLWGNQARVVWVRGGMPDAVGSEADPFLVSTYAHLKSIQTLGLDKVYRLVADIDASPSRRENRDSGFTPIGGVFYNGNQKVFRGAFHGGGHAIRGLFMLRNRRTGGPGDEYQMAGLFRSNAGLIDSLFLEEVEIEGYLEVGALVGRNQGRIRHCRSSGRVSGTAFVGGLVGVNSGGGTVRQSSSSVAVRGMDLTYIKSSPLGGLVGAADSLDSCFATGDVEGHANVGGLAGSVKRIRHSFATGDVKGGDHVGGLAGIAEVIEECYATGFIRGTGEVGGLVGWLDGSMAASYATGSVQGSRAGAGALVGIATPSRIVSSYAATTSLVPPGRQERNDSVGLVGIVQKARIDSCLWDTASGFSKAAGVVQDSLGLSVTEVRSAAGMRGPSALAVLNRSAWALRPDSTLPALRTVSDNAPFAFADTLRVADGFRIEALLANDADYETGRTALTARVDSLLSGVRVGDSLAFAPGSAVGDSFFVLYRVGELRAHDTLWGNRVWATVVRSAPSSPLGIHSPAAPMRRPTGGLDVRPVLRMPLAARGEAPARLDAGEACASQDCQGIELQLPASGRISVQIFDKLGVPVIAWEQELTAVDLASLARDENGRALLSLRWNLRSASGAGVPAGVYLWKVDALLHDGTRFETVRKLGVH